MPDLLQLIFELIQYDFCEDDDEVQGNWRFSMLDNTLSITYVPYDVSPYPATTMVYEIRRVS